MPLTNWARHQMLAPITGIGNFVALPNGTYINLLTTAPASDGSSGGGLNGCVEWSLARKVVNDEGAATPRWIRQAGPNGGWEMTNDGTVQWVSADTAALASDTLIVGLGVFDNATVGLGNLVAYMSFPLGHISRRVVEVGGEWIMETGKLAIEMFRDLTQ